MSVKASAVLVTQCGSSIGRCPSNVPAIERSVQDSYFSPMEKQSAKLDADGYLLLVLLTWNQLLSRCRRETSHVSEESHVVRFGQVRIDLKAMEVCRSDRPVSLTPMEFKVLKFFVTNPNRVITRDDMLNQVWGYRNYPCTRTVDNQILKLRQKLEVEAGNPIHFRTVHGVGYKFTP
jgi:DNA-binding response OmpR family regulator